MDLFESLRRSHGAGLVHWENRRFASAPWDEVLREARAVAAGVREFGCERGDVVAAVLTNTRSTLAGVVGVWMAGCAVASLPVPARGVSGDDYVAQLAELCGHAGSPFLAVDGTLAESLAGSLPGSVAPVAWESLHRERHSPDDPPGLDDVAFVQYSSGSTSNPKGCMLTPRAIGNQLSMLAEMSQVEVGRDVVASWLPLSHDMGLFGCALFAWACDAELVLSTPARFVSDPRTWFGDCAEFGATLSAGPPSALMAAARAQRASRPRSPLALRTCVVGGEMVSWNVLETATEAFRPMGLDARVWMPAYGLAEATLVVSATGMDDRPRRALLDRTALTEGEVVTAADEEHAVAVVSSGRPCGDTTVRTREAGRVSEIMVRSPSLFSGYLGAPELTAERLRDGELATGDHGVLRDGELFVVGRADDLLCVAGRNVYVSEIEAAVNRLDEVRSGCATVVDAGEHGRSRVVLVAELRGGAATDARAVAREAARIARASSGLLLDECVFLPHGSLPKTPSGKIQRFRCRHLVASDALEPSSRVQLRRVARRAPPSTSEAAADGVAS